MKKQQSEVERIKAQIKGLGPVLPGSLSKQWNVCGSPGCRCKDPNRPRRHGPYYQLSYTLRGKSSSVFVKPADVAEARRRIRRYEQFKKLCGALVEAYVTDLRQHGTGGRPT
jgi:hypothetical protein